MSISYQSVTSMGHCKHCFGYIKCDLFGSLVDVFWCIQTLFKHMVLVLKESCSDNIIILDKGEFIAYSVVRNEKLIFLGS